MRDRHANRDTQCALPDNHVGLCSTTVKDIVMTTCDNCAAEINLSTAKDITRHEGPEYNFGHIVLCADCITLLALPVCDCF